MKWENLFEIRDIGNGNAEVIDKRTQKVVAFGAINFMRFHAETLARIEADKRVHP